MSETNIIKTLGKSDVLKIVSIIVSGFVAAALAWKTLESRVDNHSARIESNTKRLDLHEKRMEVFQISRDTDRELLIRLDERGKKVEKTLEEILAELKRK